MKRLLWFTKSSGLDMDIDSVRHEYDPEVGVLPARLSINVDIDRSGRFSRRKGWQYTGVTGTCHSVFCGGGDCLYVSDGVLRVYSGGSSSTGIRSLSTTRQVRYQQVGSHVYYMNGSDIGFVVGGASYTWTNPSTAYGIKDSTKTYSPPPVGTNLCYFNGRMYIVQGNILWFSKAYDINSFNLGGDYIPFESNITMVKGVSGGLWIGTKEGVYFLSGSGPEGFIYVKKAILGVTEGSDVEVDISKLLGSKADGVGVMFTTTGGVCLGTPGGDLLQVTEHKITLPTTNYGAGLYNGDKYIFTLGDNLSGGRLAGAMNLYNGAVSQYLNYNFNSFCKFNNKYYGATSSGLFCLDQTQKDESAVDSKASIAAKYESGPTSFGLRTEKRIRKCTVSLEAAGKVKLSIKCNEGSKNNIVSTELPFYSDNRQHTVSAPIGRDLKGRYFSFIIENVGGADFSIDEIEAFVQVLMRKPEKEGAN